MSCPDVGRLFCGLNLQIFRSILGDLGLEKVLAAATASSKRDENENENKTKGNGKSCLLCVVSSARQQYSR